jgi:hypothetical protein
MGELQAIIPQIVFFCGNYCLIETALLAEKCHYTAKSVVISQLRFFGISFVLYLSN